MSSGNVVTEYTRQELATEAAILKASALVGNAVLRRALAIAACEFVLQAGREGTPDAGLGLMVSWVMKASDELERGAVDGR